MKRNVTFAAFCARLHACSIVLLAFVAFLVAPAAFALAVPAQVQDGTVIDEFEGIYEGSLTINTPKSLTLPLQMSLVLSEEEEPGEGGDIRRINGAFLVDGESGPYAFNRVALRLDNARLEMRYLRSNLGAQAPVPASLLFSGTLKAGGLIEGSVTSGVRGAIGSFSVKRKAQARSFTKQVKYAGRWEGYCYRPNFEGKWDATWMTVFIAPAVASVRNPDDYELEFTPGKTGGLYLGTQIPMGTIQVDYLRRRIKMANSTGEGGAAFVLDAEFEMDKKGDLVGFLNSPYIGFAGSFRLRRAGP